MPSPRIWLRNWINNALYEEEGWPHDPVNRGILLGILYLGIPVFASVAVILSITGWKDSTPVWLSASLLVYPFIAGWIALDEWRSRRRSEGGSGHGWISQMVEAYRPRRRFNQWMIAIIAIAHFAGAILVYIDRFVANDLEHLETVRLVEATAVVSVDMWLIGLTIALFRWAPSLSYWGPVKLIALALLAVNALLSVGSSPWPWQLFALMLVVVLGIPGWLVHSVWKWRSHAENTTPAGPLTAADLPNWW